MGVLHFATTLLLGCAFLFTTFSPVCCAITPFPDPNDDPFYAQPAHIESIAFKAGQVIANRTVPTVIVTLLGDSHQIKYKTLDGQNQSVSTVATLWTPFVPRSPPAILSYQFAEDALNLDCAPSWAFVLGSPSSNKLLASFEGPLVIPWALGQGYHVVVPDAEGPKSTWLVGRMEGQATLDGIRAAANFKHLDLNKTQVALYGYSGGGYTTAKAVTLAQSYAPEINIIGAAFGGTPIDQNATFAHLNTGPQAILVGGGLFGMAAGHPTLEASFQSGPNCFSTAGRAAESTFRSRNYALNSHQSQWAGTDWNTLFITPLSTNPVLRSVWASESLLQTVSPSLIPVPLFPRYEYHSKADETVPYGPEAQFVEEQCARGADIQFKTYETGNHFHTAVDGLNDALSFIAQAFKGKTPKCACGTTNCK